MTSNPLARTGASPGGVVRAAVIARRRSNSSGEIFHDSSRACSSTRSNTGVGGASALRLPRRLIQRIVKTSAQNAATTRPKNSMVMLRFIGPRHRLGAQRPGNDLLRFLDDRVQVRCALEA